MGVLLLYNTFPEMKSPQKVFFYDSPLTNVCASPYSPRLIR